MKYLTFLFVCILLACGPKTQDTDQTADSAPAMMQAQNEAHALILESMEKTGTYEDLLALKDVQYEYIYKKSPTEVDVSEERYVFAGEKSWAQYDVHTASLMTDRPGRIVQGYDGQNSWTTLDGELMSDPQMVKQADFLRKTNFYWFAMMQKLNDPGLQYTMMPEEQVGDIHYKVVKLTFDSEIGDVQDDYVLYINPDTGLIDRFTFTVRDYGIEQPLLMEVKYTQHEGLRLPTYRRYAPIDSTGQVVGTQWVEEISDKIKFNNNFPADMFKPPVTG